MLIQADMMCSANKIYQISCVLKFMREERWSARKIFWKGTTFLFLLYIRSFITRKIMPPPKRERYNAKARQSSVGSSHKKHKRSDKAEVVNVEGADGVEPHSSNAFLIDPEVEKERREAGRKRREVSRNKERFQLWVVF